MAIGVDFIITVRTCSQLGALSESTPGVKGRVRVFDASSECGCPPFVHKDSSHIERERVNHSSPRTV